MTTTESTFVAIVNFTAGRAIILEDGKPIRKLKITMKGDTKGPEPIPNGFHIHMWLGSSELTPIGIGAPPYKDLQTTMVEHLTLFYLITCFSTSLDPDMSKELRTKSAKLLEGSLCKVRQAVADRFTNIILSKPIPNTASTRDAPFTGKGAELLAKLVARDGHRP